MTTIKIDNKKIGANYPVFIVAELSGNHNKSFERAKKMVKAACQAGANAIKTQTYKPETMTIKSSKKWFQVKVNPVWEGRTLYDLYEWAYTPWEWLPELKSFPI